VSADRWTALRPEQAATILQALAVPWWIAGGWALDLFLDVTTAHRDLDVCLLRRDEAALRAALPGWEVQATPPDALLRCRPAGRSEWQLEVVLDDADGDDWCYRRDRRVRRPLAEIGWQRGAVPVLRPEIVLLFKAEEPERSRFDEAVPGLSPGARTWLRCALELAHPGHPWIGKLR
jgi:hypothetical protein